jgi:hypothetical protein
MSIDRLHDPASAAPHAHIHESRRSVILGIVFHFLGLAGSLGGGSLLGHFVHSGVLFGFLIGAWMVFLIYAFKEERFYWGFLIHVFILGGLFLLSMGLAR